MSKTLVGFVTFGNLKYTKLAVQSLVDTVKSDIDLFAVVGKFDDLDTLEWVIEHNIPYILHLENLGFPYSLNDIYDYAFKENDYDNLIIMGNDIVAYPNAIDSMIEIADTTDYLVVSALQYDVRDLYKEYPEARKFIGFGSYTVTDLNNKPWELFTYYDNPTHIADMQLYDIQNLCLYKREAFETIGYTDVNFYPAYFVDNDYARRIVNSGIKCCSLVNARFFHFWSRTIKEESGGSNDKYFQANARYYRDKWGGDFGFETKEAPTKIDSREGEIEAIKKWRDG